MRPSVHSLSYSIFFPHPPLLRGFLSFSPLGFDHLNRIYGASNDGRLIFLEKLYPIFLMTYGILLLISPDI